MRYLSFGPVWKMGWLRASLAAAAVLALGAAAGGPARTASAGSLCVNPGGTGGCFGTITAAVAAASAGDTIHIAGAGSPYLERLTISKSLSLIGDDPATTRIDGGAAGQVIRISGAIAVTLANLTIQDGQAGPGNTADNYGAGIHNEMATLTLNNVVVSNNHTGGFNTCCAGDGGGIYNDQGTLTLNHSLVTDNTTGSPDPSPTLGGQGGAGAGIENKGGVVTINDSAIRNNFAGQGANSPDTGGPGGAGGGIANLGGTLRLNRSTVSDNASGNGGEGDTQGGNGGVGGGIYSAVGNVTIIASTISFNGSGSGGAGGTQGQSGNGAGLYVNSVNLLGARTLAIANSTLSNNETGRGLANGFGGDGGAIYSTDHMTVTLTNDTLAFNTADIGRVGGAIANFGAATIQNSLLAENSDASGTAAVHDCSGTLTSLGYNVVMEPDCTVSPNANGTTGDQFFVRGDLVDPLAENGGPTQTHALPPGSLAIDAADNSACSPTDQRGFARPAFGGTALRCDVGAFERYRFAARLPLLVR